MEEYNKTPVGATESAFSEARSTTNSDVGAQSDAPKLRDDAVSHARNGFRVFPLVPNGKTPIIEEWHKQASNDPNRAYRFWSEPLTGDPLDYNIGIATGNGLFVLDVDNKDGKNGSATLARLELEHGSLPPTLVVCTASGGFHYYFRALPDLWIPNSAGKLGEGLDVRGDGGYVVGPGSIIDGLTYKPEPQL